MTTPSLRRTRQDGFTLVEALVALLVLAFGMLAVAGFQTLLSANSDRAKQRSEAVRLAQQKMEELRSFVTLSSDADRLDYADDLVGSDEIEDTATKTIIGGGTFQGQAYSSNTTFTRSWTVTSDGKTAAGPNDLQKWIMVTVTWDDRSGTGTENAAAEGRSVTLRSVISRSDPANLRLWPTTGGSSTVRRPRNRNIDIPYPSIDFGDGTSGFMPGGATNVYFIFDNDSGYVTYRCTGTSVVKASANSGCAELDTAAYLLSGNVYYYGANPSPAASDLTLTINNRNNNLQDVKPLNAAVPVEVRFVSPSTSAAAECFAQHQYVGTSTNAIHALTSSVATLPSSPPSRDYAFTVYLCVVRPVVPGGSGTPRWSGQFVINPLSAGTGAWNLGLTSSEFKVCRFTGDYDGDNSMSNAEHPLYYRAVTGSLGGQNYVVVKGNHTCPTDTEAALLAQPPKLINNNTLVHQSAPATGTQPYGGVLSAGPQWSTGENASTTVELAMD